MSEFSQIGVKRLDGDIIEVKLRNADYTPYFKAKAKLNDRKEMRKLMSDLRHKGINFKSGWFD